MENRKEDQIIYLKDLIFAALHRWRAILVFAVVGAVLLGGVKGISSWRDTHIATSDLPYQAQLTEYENSLESLHTKMESLQATFDSHRAYTENSIFMQLDPYAFYQTTLTFYADTNYQINPGLTYQNTDKITGVLAAYEAVFTGDSVKEQLALAANTQPQFITELLSCSTSVPQGTVTVSVLAATKECAQAFADTLVAQLDVFQKEVSLSVGEHTVSILDRSIAEKVDLELADEQAKVEDILIDLENKLEETSQELAALAAPAVPSGSAKDVIIFAVLGGIIGAFLSVGVLWVAYIASDKVYSVKTLINRTGLKVLGCLPVRQKCPLDRWLNKLEGRCTAETDAQADLLAAHIRNRCRETHQLLVTGNTSSAGGELLFQKLGAALPGVQIANAPDLFNNIVALDALLTCDAVVLIEECGVSRYSHVNRQIELIRDYKKELIGCILVKG